LGAADATVCISAERRAELTKDHTAAEVRQAYEDGRASMLHLLPEKPTRGVLMTVRSAVGLATGGQLRLADAVIELIYHNIRQATRLTAFHSKDAALTKGMDDKEGTK